MNQHYWKRLSLAARWKLPPAEAREVLADYQDMFAQDERSEAELCRDLGKPVQVVQVLMQPKIYHRWLIVFFVLTACLFLPVLYPLPFIGLLSFRFLIYDLSGWPVEWILLAGGLALSLVWFQVQGVQGRPFPKKILFFLAVQLVGVACVWAVIGLMLALPWTLAHFVQVAPSFGMLVAFWLSCFIFLLALLSVFGLIKARMEDRRWRAVYILGLTAGVLFFYTLTLMWNMTLDDPQPYWQIPHLRQCICLTAFGLIGTGVSLC